MTEAPFISSTPERVNPERLGLLLQESGWQVVGQRSGAYLRLARPADDSVTVLVPLDREAPEFGDAMRAALADLERMVSRDVWTANISARLTSQPADGFRFRKEAAAPPGLIGWSQGELLIKSSRLALVAGAKAHMAQLRYFSNRFGQFANRYLDTVLMGQTAPGSYIVSAFVPASGYVASGAASIESPLFGAPADAEGTREIGVSVMRAVEATAEAVEHYRANASLSAFEGLVQRGVSYEMASALRGLVQDSDGAEVSVAWDPDVSLPADAPVNHVEFRPSDVEVLTKGANQLSVAAEPPERLVITGRVHLLSRRDAGGPGVVGIENLLDYTPKRVRVHLTDEDYHRALGAHDEDRAVIVEGHAEREGNIHWMYDGRLISVSAPLRDMGLRAFGKQVGRDQMELGDEEEGG